MPSMIDTRFAAPPEDFELLKEPSSSAKGKGRLEERVKPTAVRKAKKQQQERWQPAHDNDSASNSEHDLYDEILNGPIPSTSYGTGSHNEDADDIGPGNDEDADEMRDNEDEPLNLIPKVLQLDNVEDFNKKVDRTGLIYLSRIPPGMGPSKVKHILSNYGEIGRIYLVAALDEKRKTSSSSSSHGSSKKNDHKHRPHRFVEGWVEFMDKRVARSTAELLNARPIGDIAMSKGSKKNGGTRKWQDDVWTMKYLPRFKWNMLSEQVGEWRDLHARDTLHYLICKRLLERILD